MLAYCPSLKGLSILGIIGAQGNFLLQTQIVAESFAALLHPRIGIAPQNQSRDLACQGTGHPSARDGLEDALDPLLGIARLLSVDSEELAHHYAYGVVIVGSDRGRVRTCVSQL